MKAYIYQAALLCEDCTRKRVNTLLAGSSREIADTGDSDDFPQGPYSDGGGEADCPQHCDRCSVFLENPLTSDGEAWVKERIEHSRINRNVQVGYGWRERYAYLFKEGIDTIPAWANYVETYTNDLCRRRHSSFLVEGIDK